jgi:hypothetical protein
LTRISNCSCGGSFCVGVELEAGKRGLGAKPKGESGYQGRRVEENRGGDGKR